MTTYETVPTNELQQIVTGVRRVGIRLNKTHQYSIMEA